MNQPTNQFEIRFNTMLAYKKWSTYLQSERQEECKKAFNSSHFFFELLDAIDHIDSITVAWHEAKTRLRRNLTPTELVDILGWAA